MKVALITLGCPKNEVDSWIMRSHLARAGFEIASVDEADAIIVNTCAFIREAKEESIDTILEALELGKPVYVAGCLYQRYGGELVENLPEVAGWISLGCVRDVASVLEKGEMSPLRPAVLPCVDDFSHISPVSFVYVKISEGCDNRCNYCAIPSIRGNLRSRPLGDVLDEVRMWVDRGAREVILVSQDTSSYGRDLGMDDGLLRLLEKIEGIEGRFWVRVLYMHPAGVSEELFRFIRDSEKVVNYVEVPFQHVSESVLEAMGRRGGRRAVERVVELVDELGLLLRTTFLVGHPGEGEEEFEELVRFVEDVRPWRFSVFGYSPEEGTLSADMEQVSQDIVKERVSVLMELMDRMVFENNLELVGRTLEVLADGRNHGRFYGMAPDIDGLVFVEGASLDAGRFYRVVIEDAVGVDLIGRPSSV